MAILQTTHLFHRRGATKLELLPIGRQLLNEIAEVERQRVALDILEYDDDSPYQESTA